MQKRKWAAGRVEWGEEKKERREEDVLFQAKAVNEVDAGRDRATRSEMIERSGLFFLAEGE